MQLLLARDRSAVADRNIQQVVSTGKELQL